MSRRSMVLLWTLVVSLSVVWIGCPKQKPTPPPPPPPPAPAPAPAQEVTPPPAPDTGADVKQDPLSEDLETANRYAHREGLLGDVYFDFDRYELKPEARERLAKNAEFMRQHPEFVFAIEGHCDERGTNEYNLALGDRRASAARDYLLSLGVSADRFKTISYGEERPVCTESNEACWWRNRRAAFVISGRG